MSDSDEFYKYVPSLGAAISFAVIFCLTTVLHAWQCFRSKSWYMLPLIIGGVCEVVGYALRIIAHFEAPEYTLVPYIIQAVLILVASIFISATIYIIMAHMIVGLDAEKYCPLRRKWFTRAFILGDINALNIQGTGAGLLPADSPAAREAGKYIIIAGLFLQLLMFGYFLYILISFDFRMKRKPTTKSKRLSFSWRKHWWILLAVSILVMIRSIFRVVEYIEGEDGYLLSNELYLYVFDAILMAGVCIILNFVHPSEITSLATGSGAVHKVLFVNHADNRHAYEDLETTNSSAGEATQLRPLTQ